MNRGQPIASGGFADTHEAELNGNKVCIKVLRMYIQDAKSVTKKVRSCFYPSPATVTGTSGPIDVLQRSCRVEEVTTSQHRSFPRSSHEGTAIRDCFCLDGEW